MDISRMDVRQYGENTNLECRAESHEKVDKEKRKRQIMKYIIKGDFTATELAETMYEDGVIPFPERNMVQPRLTEMLQGGMVTIIGKKTCHRTGRTVSVYHAYTPLISAILNRR